MTVVDDLESLRARLDAIDRRLLETLRERLDTVAGIARLKAQGLPFLRDHERESELLARVEGRARELDLDSFRTQEIFREILAMSLKSQEEALLHRERVERSSKAARRVAFQGTEGSYSQLAARKYFAARSSAMEFIGVATFAEALAMAERGDVGYAFLPIENTTAGSINQTYDLLRQTDLKIVGEEALAAGAIFTIPAFIISGAWDEFDLRDATAIMLIGGVLGVVQHRADNGTDPAVTAEQGYVSEEAVIAMATAAGLVFEASSEINANPNDSKEHEFGVWTLPPSLRACRDIEDEAEKADCQATYQEIGESDRMTLRFRKPLG